MFIANESFPCQFGCIARKDLALNKSLFLLDMLEIGKRKYTQLRQHLTSSDIPFPAYQRVIDHRNSITLRSSLQLYPNPAAPIDVNVSYSEYVRHTFTRIMATITPPSSNDFPLTFHIADGLDGSGSHTIYNQHGTNTCTKSFLLFASNQLPSPLVPVLNSGKI